MENHAGLIELIVVIAVLCLGWLVLDRQGKRLDRARDAARHDAADKS